MHHVCDIPAHLSVCMHGKLELGGKQHYLNRHASWHIGPSVLHSRHSVASSQQKDYFIMIKKWHADLKLNSDDTVIESNLMSGFQPNNSTGIVKNPQHGRIDLRAILGILGLRPIHSSCMSPLLATGIESGTDQLNQLHCLTSDYYHTYHK